MHLAATVELFHHRWNVRVLAALHEANGGSRISVLTHHLDAHRATIRASVAALTRGGWVEPNPGYGHPLRPEFVLTKSGRRLAVACAEYDRVASRLRALEVGYRKWSAPVLVTLHDGNERFNGIQHALGCITPRALAQSLKELSAQSLVVREVEDEYPPRVGYHLSRTGRQLANATQGIVAVRG